MLMCLEGSWVWREGSMPSKGFLMPRKSRDGFKDVGDLSSWILNVSNPFGMGRWMMIQRSRRLCFSSMWYPWVRQLQDSHKCDTWKRTRPMVEHGGSLDWYQPSSKSLTAIVIPTTISFDLLHGAGAACGHWHYQPITSTWARHETNQSLQNCYLHLTTSIILCWIDSQSCFRSVSKTIMLRTWKLGYNKWRERCCGGFMLLGGDILV